jgi:hypothetical protein
MPRAQVVALNDEYAASIEEGESVEIFAYRQEGDVITEDIYAGSVLLDHAALWTLFALLMPAIPTEGGDQDTK